jgi:hypothetical protein
VSAKYVTIEDLAAAIEVVEPNKEAYESYERAIKKADDTIFKVLVSGSGRRFGGVPSEDLDPPSYLPMREPLPSRIPDLCPDDTQRHKDGSVRPPNCRCVEECWTDEDDAAWRKEWREST